MQQRVICVKNFPTHLSEKDVYNLSRDLFHEFGSIEFNSVCKQSQDDQYSATLFFEEESAATAAVDEFKRNPKHLGSPKGPLDVNWDNTTPFPIAGYMPMRMPMPMMYAPQGPLFYRRSWNKTKREDTMPLVNLPTLRPTPLNNFATFSNIQPKFPSNFYKRFPTNLQGKAKLSY